MTPNRNDFLSAENGDRGGERFSHSSTPNCGSNSRWEADGRPRYVVESHGVDTVRYAWRIKADVAAAFLAAVRARHVRCPNTGEPLRARRNPHGEILIAHPSWGVAWLVRVSSGYLALEGRLAAICAGAADDRHLTDVTMLRRGADAGRLAAMALGVELDDEAHVRRCDPAAEIRFGTPAGGRAFLSAVACLPLGRLKAQTVRGHTGIETVFWAGEKGRQIRVRLYDAGVHRDTDLAGVRLRLEHQVRYAAGDAPTPDAVSRLDLAEWFLGPLGKLIDVAPERLIVAGPDAAVLAILEQVRRGLPRQAGMRLIGTARTFGLHLEDEFFAPDAQRKARAELRRRGVVLDAMGGRTEQVDVRGPLIALAHPWHRVNARR